jgi:Lipopolysaccharide-assembly
MLKKSLALTKVPSARRGLVPLIVLASMVVSGCGYTVRPPYDRSIRTVYVGIFKSQSFRRDQNIDLTNLIQQEIRLRTPYSVVGSPDGADARLEGTITYVDKNTQVENPYNLPRHLLASMTATVTYIDNRSGVSTTKTTPPSVVGEMAPFYPEIGETTQLGFEKAMQKMAKDIVSMMEQGWGPEYRDDPDAAPFDPNTSPMDAPRTRNPSRGPRPVPAQNQ